MADTFNIGLGSKAPTTFKAGEEKKVTKEQRKLELQETEKKSLELAKDYNTLFATTSDPKVLHNTVAQYSQKDKILSMELRRRETDLYYSENPEETPKNYKPTYGFDTEAFKIGKGSAKQSVFSIGESKPKVESDMATGIGNGYICKSNLAIQKGDNEVYAMENKIVDTNQQIGKTQEKIDKTINRGFTAFE